MAIATYQRVSKQEQARDTEAFERQGWQLDREAKKYPDVGLHFSDIQSGRRDDRPGMQALIAAIESGNVSLLIITRIDRIGRDLESNTQLQKLLERKNVRVYEILLGRFLDWKNPNDWSYFVQAGLDGEKESRMLSTRIKQTFEYQRAHNRIGGGSVGFPYRRDSEGNIEPNPDEWDKAIEAIKIVVQHDGSVVDALHQINRDLGLNRSINWLSNWIRSPLIRGHTPVDTYLGQGKDRRRKPISQWQLFENTHPSLFDAPELARIGARAEIDRIVTDSRAYKGKAIERQIRALSGLIYCARCGGSCRVRSSADTRYNNPSITYAYCTNRIDRGTNCGGDKKIDGKRNLINTRYEDIELAAMVALSQRAESIIDLSLNADIVDAPADTPEIVKLRADIDRLSGFNDPDLASAIADKTSRLNALILASAPATHSIERRNMFVDLFASGDVLAYATEIEKRTIYRAWISRIDIDRQQIEVLLTI